MRQDNLNEDEITSSDLVTCISLLIILCMIVYVTNNKEP